MVSRATLIDLQTLWTTAPVRSTAHRINGRKSPASASTDVEYTKAESGACVLLLSGDSPFRNTLDLLLGGWYHVAVGVIEKADKGMAMSS